MAQPNEESLSQIQAEIEDPTSDLGMFTQYVQRTEYSPEHEAATQQDIVDLFGSITDDPNGFVGVPVAQEVALDSTVGSRFQLAVQDAISLDNIQEHKDQFVSPNHVMEQEVVPNFGTINMENFNDNSPFPQKFCIKSSMNSDTVLQTEIPNQPLVVKPISIQEIIQNMEVKPSNPGPLRISRVGRNRQNETPLYLLPEPEDEQEKRKWRRAKTAYLHRQNKKNALEGNSKKIEDLLKEVNELKNQLKVVTAERDTYKNMCMTMCMNKSQGEKIAFIQ